MIKTVEAVLDEQGNVRLLEPVHPGQARRALVIVLDEQARTRRVRARNGAPGVGPRSDRATGQLRRLVPARRREGLAQVERGQTVSHGEVGTRLEQRLTEQTRRR